MRFYKITVAGVFEPDSPSTRKLGDSGSEFLEVHSDDFFGDLTGNVTGDVTGDLTGDIYEHNGVVKVLDNGNGGNDAWFRGDVYAEDLNAILHSGADRANSFASLKYINNENGNPVLTTDPTAANSTFAGISEKAKYA